MGPGRTGRIATVTGHESRKPLAAHPLKSSSGGQEACEGFGTPYSDMEGCGVPLRPSCTGRAADENLDNRDDRLSDVAQRVAVQMPSPPSLL